MVRVKTSEVETREVSICWMRDVYRSLHPVLNLLLLLFVRCCAGDKRASAELIWSDEPEGEIGRVTRPNRLEEASTIKIWGS